MRTAARFFALFLSFIAFGAVGRVGYSLIKVFIDLSPIFFALFMFIYGVLALCIRTLFRSPFPGLNRISISS